VKPKAATLGRPLDRDLIWLGLIALALPLARAGLLAAGGFDLHFDEAQYWEWSRRLDWGYYSKGPLVAWLIAASTGLLGHGEWQVRLPAWLAYDAWLAVLFLFAREVWDSSRAGWTAVALGLATPLYFLLGGVMTTDVLLLTLWTAGLWAAYRLASAPGPGAWYAFGAAVGLGVLTKLSIGLLPLTVLPALLTSPTVRRQLLGPHPWLAALLALALASPVVGWNVANDWVMLRHERGHVAVSEARLGSLLELVAGQALALSPPLAVLIGWRLLRWPAHPPQRVLWLGSVAVVVFFLAKAAASKVQINWPAPAYIGLLVLLAGQVEALSRGQRRLFGPGLALGALFSLLALFPRLVGLPGDRDPFAEMKAWRAPVEELARQAGPVDFLLTSRYHLTAELAFYWPQPIEAYVTSDRGRRMNQNDHRPGVNREVVRDRLFVATQPQGPTVLGQVFASCAPLEPVPARAADGRLLRTLYGWRCEGYRPIDWPRPESY
jgi:undecaprenyl-diphosphatase